MRNHFNQADTDTHAVVYTTPRDEAHTPEMLVAYFDTVAAAQSWLGEVVALGATGARIESIVPDDQIKGDVCVDCLMVIANGDTSGIDDLAGWELRVDAKNPTDNGAYMVVPVGDETFFGRGACDYCGSTIAGDRHDVVFVDMRAGGVDV